MKEKSEVEMLWDHRKKLQKEIRRLHALFRSIKNLKANDLAEAYDIADEGLKFNIEGKEDE